MRTAIIILLLFLTYSLLYLTSSQKEIVYKKYRLGKNTKIKSFLGVDKNKQDYIKMYTLHDIKESIRYNFIQIYEIFIEQLLKYKKFFFIVSCVFVAISVISTVFLYKSKISFIVKIINLFGFSAGETFIVIVSFLSLGSWLFLKQNLWRDVGSFLFFIPAGFILITSINLKIYDFNYPIWSRLFKSFFIPIGVGIFIALKI
ncbi:MAG: hypothetical protein ABDH23_02585 [Endomicrobiia bacterium]